MLLPIQETAGTPSTNAASTRAATEETSLSGREKTSRAAQMEFRSRRWGAEGKGGRTSRASVVDPRHALGGVHAARQLGEGQGVTRTCTTQQRGHGRAAAC